METKQNKVNMPLGEGIVKINSRILESTELKRLDKLEKEGIHVLGSTNKGKKKTPALIHLFLSSCHFDLRVNKCLMQKFKNIHKNKKRI